MNLDTSQQQLMRYDPVCGTSMPYPSHAAQYRTFHGKVAWLYNPWTKARRDARDIGSDVTGLLICSELEPVEQGYSPECCEPTKPSGPRVTPYSIEENISSEYYFTAANGINGEIEARGSVPHCYESSLGMLTFCVLVLRNGFAVTGESACVSPENFDAELGRKIARENAISKVWPLMGYALKDRLFDNAAKVNKGAQA
jgi:hypothetical protein